MKKIAFILGLVALFAVSCNSNNSTTQKGSDLEDLLVEFQTEDPQEAAKHKAITDSDYYGKNKLLKGMVESDYCIEGVEGSIGHVDSLYSIIYNNPNTFSENEEWPRGLFIWPKNTTNTFGLGSNDPSNFSSNATKIEYYNLETGYVVFAIRKNGVLHCILRGYLHVADDFTGVLYTNETKLPFSFNKSILD
ncbi:MAG: hypothetical protein U0L37_05185 [Bacteroidales bacterium]|nr:hypothetical protein [Bacteroidales bacterium]